MDTAREKWRARSQAMRSEHFSARTLDVGDALDARAIGAVRGALAQFGAVHVQRTGLRTAEAARAIMGALGFGEREQFSLGGRTSESWQRKWVEPGLRRMDFYPPELYLLANNEVQYRRTSPARVLFFCERAAAHGGRAFVHSAARVERALTQSALGRSLLDRLRAHGMLIETGFLSKDHPAKAENYFQSWQERFGTEDADEALARARAQRDEHDACELMRDGASSVLRTRITIEAFWPDPTTGERFLRFPRVALDPPSAKNGYRRFSLGDASALTDEENDLLRAVYFATREGTTMRDGDLILFDNLRFGHSRESFDDPQRALYVAMAGELRAQPERAIIEPARFEGRFAGTVEARAQGQRYAIGAPWIEREERFSMRTFDARGSLDDAMVEAVLREFEAHGAVHVRRTGVVAERPGELDPALLSRLRFGAEHSFAWGGSHSGRTSRKALSRELRATDEYPAHLWLLPHNEVLYQSNLPARLLFFSASACPIAQGGRTFVHEAEQMRRWLAARGPEGRALLDALRTHGMRIEMGFLDERHPDKARNYFRSWQERFDTQSMDEALARCKASTHQFDECWWRPEPSERGPETMTLMTRVTVPAFFTDENGVEHMFFPRVALDPPSALNGHRSYPLGDGRALDDREIDLLLGAFLATREAVHYEAGDILLVDNLRYGHSRESFSPPRTLGVAMAGSVNCRPRRDEVEP